MKREVLRSYDAYFPSNASVYMAQLEGTLINAYTISDSRTYVISKVSKFRNSAMFVIVNMYIIFPVKASQIYL
jgi:hypothetical protein